MNIFLFICLWFILLRCILNNWYIFNTLHFARDYLSLFIIYYCQLYILFLWFCISVVHVLHLKIFIFICFLSLNEHFLCFSSMYFIVVCFKDVITYVSQPRSFTCKFYMIIYAKIYKMIVLFNNRVLAIHDQYAN